MELDFKLLFNEATFFSENMSLTDASNKHEILKNRIERMQEVIHQRDQAIKQAVIREIKEIPKDKPKLGSENQELYVSYSNGYNQAIKDILTHLNNKE